MLPLLWLSQWFSHILPATRSVWRPGLVPFPWWSLFPRVRGFWVDGSRTAPALFPSHVEISSRAHRVGQDQSTVAERVETTVDDRFPAEVRVSLFP